MQVCYAVSEGRLRTHGCVVKGGIVSQLTAQVARHSLTTDKCLRGGLVRDASAVTVRIVLADRFLFVGGES